MLLLWVTAPTRPLRSGNPLDGSGFCSPWLRRCTVVPRPRCASNGGITELKVVGNGARRGCGESSRRFFCPCGRSNFLSPAVRTCATVRACLYRGKALWSSDTAPRSRLEFAASLWIILRSWRSRIVLFLFVRFGLRGSVSDGATCTDARPLNTGFLQGSARGRLEFGVFVGD